MAACSDWGCAFLGPVALGITVGARPGALGFVLFLFVAFGLDGCYFASSPGVDRDSSSVADPGPIFELSNSKTVTLKPFL